MKPVTRFLLIALLSLGIFFRLAHLDRKVYWYDEAFTSLRATGYTEAEIVQRFSNIGIVYATELQQYQHPSPDRSITDTLSSLAREDTQHPPLFYIIAHYWSRWIGSSISNFRLLAVLFSLLSLPAVYWLGQELWIETGAGPSSLPVWFSVVFFALSPFQIVYAQESRQYSLWGTLILVMTAALLRALRQQTRNSWFLYALTVAAGLYTFLFTGLVCLAHGVYVLLQQPRQVWLRFGIATLISVTLFLPWAGILASNFAQAHAVTQWTEYKLPLSNLVKSWLSTIGCLFYDRGETRLDQLVQFCLIILVLYAFYWLCRSTPRPVWLLIVTLTMIPVLPLWLADLFIGGMRTTVPRYFMPTLFGIQLAVAYLLGAKLSKTRVPPRLWVGITGFLCGFSLIACLINFQAVTSWQKDHNQENLELAQLLSQAPNSLLISDAETGDLLSLSHNLDATIPLLIQPRCFTCNRRQSDSFDPALLQMANKLQIANNFSSIYLFHPRSSYSWQQSLLRNLGVNFELITLKSQEGSNKLLWRIVNK